MSKYLCLKCQETFNLPIPAKNLICPILSCGGEIVITDPVIIQAINKYHKSVKYGKFVNVSNNYSSSLKLDKNILASLPGIFELKLMAMRN